MQNPDLKESGFCLTNQSIMKKLHPSINLDVVTSKLLHGKLKIKKCLTV